MGKDDYNFLHEVFIRLLYALLLLDNFWREKFGYHIFTSVATNFWLNNAK
jgi:hypothetical protein